MAQIPFDFKRQLERERKPSEILENRRKAEMKPS